jgi:ribose 5-phosphate isomerase A
MRKASLRRVNLGDVMSHAIEEAKKLAAQKAADLVSSGMRLGLGTGSTAKYFVEFIGAKTQGGMDLVCVPTSQATHDQAKSLGIKLTTLDETPELDLTVDGADEFDPSLRLIKGGGGALLREKIVASASRRMVVITDRSKQVATLGRFPLPVEVVSFGLEATRRHIVQTLQRHGCTGTIKLRTTPAGTPFISDGGHYILDCAMAVLPKPEEIAQGLAAIPGVVEHGLFLGLASAVFVADAAGVDIIGAPLRERVI